MERMDADQKINAVGETAKVQESGEPPPEGLGQDQGHGQGGAGGRGARNETPQGQKKQRGEEGVKNASGTMGQPRLRRWEWMPLEEKGRIEKDDMCIEVGARAETILEAGAAGANLATKAPQAAQRKLRASIQKRRQADCLARHWGRIIG